MLLLFRLSAGNMQQKISTVRMNFCRKELIVFTTMIYEPATHDRKNLEKRNQSLHKYIHKHTDGRGLEVSQLL